MGVSGCTSKGRLLVHCVQIKLYWNLEMLVFEERGRPVYPEKNLSEQGWEPTTNSTHTWHRVQESKPGHLGRRRVLSPLRHDPASLNICVSPLWIHFTSYMIGFTVTIFLNISGGILDYTGNHLFWSEVAEQEGHATVDCRVDGTVTRASKRWPTHACVEMFVALDYPWREGGIACSLEKFIYTNWIPYRWREYRFKTQEGQSYSFPLSFPVFPSPQKPTHPNSNSILELSAISILHFIPLTPK